MVKLPPNEFEYGKYHADTIPYSVAVGKTQQYIDFLLRSNIIGYCESVNCPVRIKTDQMSVMIEDEDGYVTWGHVPIEIWNEFMKQLTESEK